jgi:hypothetical protein
MLVPYGDVPATAQACRVALQNTWDRRAILIRAQQFSFAAFKTRLAPLLGA